MKLTLILFIFSNSLQASTLQISPENLKSLLENRNQNFAAHQLEILASKKRQGSLTRSFLPSLELYGANESFKQGRTQEKNQPLYGAELNLNLFNGGQDLLESQARKLELSQKKSESDRLSSDLLLQARQIYWNLLYTQEVITLIKSAISNNQQNLKLAERRIQSGVATQTDRFEFEMKLTDLEQELKEVELTYQILSQEMSLILNLDSGEKIQLPQQMVHEHDFEKMLAHGEKDHEFLYQEVQLQAEVVKLRAQKESRAYWPKFDVYAAYHQFNERDEEFPNAKDRTESVLGLRMTISLSQGLESENQAASQKLHAQALEKQADYKKREVEFHIKNEMSELELKHDQIHAAEENSKRAEKYYNLTKSEYSRGVKNSPDVLGASEKLFSSKRKQLEIIRDFQVAKSHVLSKIGR